MPLSDSRSRHHYATAPDRAGYAIAAGGVLTGALIAGLVALSGQHAPIALIMAWLLGSLFGMLGITAVAAPLWLALHLAGWRGPRAAAALGAGLALFIFLGGQLHGFGMLSPLPDATQSLGSQALTAIVTALVLAAIGAAIALMMWRIAYRKLF